MSQPHRDPFKDAVKALAQERDDILSDAKLNAVYHRIEADIESPKRSAMVFRVAFAGGFAALLAVASVWWLTRQPMPPAPTTAALQPRLLLRSGDNLPVTHQRRGAVSPGQTENAGCSRSCWKEQRGRGDAEHHDRSTRDSMALVPAEHEGQESIDRDGPAS